MTFLRLAIQNFSHALARDEELDGKEYKAVPMIMILEGVHEGTAGKVFYPADELGDTPQMWNTRPIIIRHPLEGTTGTAPAVIRKQGVGIIMNSRWDAAESKLKGEAWIDKNKANKLDKRILDFVATGTPVEVSTGMTADCEESSGIWNNEAYEKIARNIRADHLAILLDEKGACSIEDGAGLLMNSATPGYDSIKRQLGPLLPDDTYIVEIWDSFVVYSEWDDNTFHKIGYELDDQGKAKLVGVAEEVREVQKFESLDGTTIGNVRKTKRKEEPIMNKSKIVNDLIMNTASAWGEDDRKTLLQMDDDLLRKIYLSQPLANEATADKSEEDEDEDDKKKKNVENKSTAKPSKKSRVIHNEDTSDDEDEDEEKAKKKNVENKAKSEPAPAPQLDMATLENLINNSSGRLAETLRSGLEAGKRERLALMNRVISNPGNRFTKEQLENFDLDTLRNLADLAVPPTQGDLPETMGGDPLFNSYGGNFGHYDDYAAPGMPGFGYGGGMPMPGNQGAPQQRQPNYSGAGSPNVPIENAYYGETLDLPSTFDPPVKQ